MFHREASDQIIKIFLTHFVWGRIMKNSEQIKEVKLI